MASILKMSSPSKYGNAKGAAGDMYGSRIGGVHLKLVQCLPTIFTSECLHMRVHVHTHTHVHTLYGLYDSLE